MFGTILATTLPDLLGTGLGGGTSGEIKDFDDTKNNSDNTVLIAGVVFVLTLVVILIFLFKSDSK